MTKTFLRSALVIAISILVIGFATYAVYRVFAPRKVAEDVTKEPTITPPAPEPTVTKNNLPIPNAPNLSFLIGARPFIQIIWNWDVADYFNVYRATNPNGPWEKIIADFPQSAHTAVDYDYPKDAEILYYRITSVDREGNESEPSITSSVRISAD